MRIGILTITNGQNYGNRLQNYALQYAIKSFGHEVETIRNVTSRRDDLAYKNIVGDWLRIKLNRSNKMKAIRIKKFNSFNKEFVKFSKFKVSKDSVPVLLKDSYDFFVCGSDQVWNPNFDFNSDLDYAVFADKNKRVSYAASFGVAELEKEQEAHIAPLLKEMKCIAVREQAGADLVEKMTGTKPEVVPDPTFFLSDSDWRKVMKKPSWIKKDKFILTYYLGQKIEAINEDIQRVARQNDCDVIDLYSEFEMNDNASYTADPAEFLWLIDHAQMFYTDSFHGMALSIILKKLFICCNRVDKDKSMSSRIDQLLSTFHLENRQFLNVTDENRLVCNYAGADEIISGERKKGLAYLEKALQK